MLVSFVGKKRFSVENVSKIQASTLACPPLLLQERDQIMYDFNVNFP